MITFIEERFPADISYGMSGGPSFSTDIVTLASGKEHRNVNWSVPKARYNISHSVRTKQQMDKLNQFFRMTRGRAIGFRFKDHADFVAHQQLIAIADGKSKKFQLKKLYGSHQRIIFKPVPGSVSIYLNNILVKAEINYTNGEIIFTNAPAKGEEIKASFEFDVPVRFDTDFLSSSIDDYNTFSWNNINLIELKL